MKNFWKNLSSPFTVLAPMDDVTDNVFRKVVNEIGRPDVFFTEFTNADGIMSPGSKIVGKKLKFEPEQHPIVAQLWGNNPDTIYKSAKVVEDLGFDGVDFNMSCPVRHVMKRNCGAALIGNYDLAKEIVQALKKGAPNIPVSIKTRLGINQNTANEWVTFLFTQNIAALTVHARTAKQMSKVPADWDEIGKVIQLRNNLAPETIIIGNGDIKKFDQINEMYKKYQVDGVMIGRGIFDDPWVFSAEVKTHSIMEYVDLLTKHFAYFESENPEPEVQKKRYGSLKKFFKMYVVNFPGASILRQKLMETNTLDEARSILNNTNFV